MPDRAEDIAKKLQTALRKEDSAKGVLEASVSLISKRNAAQNYVEQHLKVKALRAGLIHELELPEPSLQEILDG